MVAIAGGGYAAVLSSRPVSERSPSEENRAPMVPEPRQDRVAAEPERVRRARRVWTSDPMCPYRFAILAVVLALQPMIDATTDRDPPRSKSRVQAVCQKWI